MPPKLSAVCIQALYLAQQELTDLANLPGAVGTILIHYSKTHVVVEVNRKLPALKLVEDDPSTR